MLLNCIIKNNGIRNKHDEFMCIKMLVISKLFLTMLLNKLKGMLPKTDTIKRFLKSILLPNKLLFFCT